VYDGAEDGARDFLIVDDICDGGRTFIELAKVLRPLTSGQVKLYVTHGIFSAGFEALAGLDRIFVANPFPADLPGFVQTV
jgi:ribose-phosphate pyrophosphokinase